MSRSEAETIWMSSSAMNMPTHMLAKANTFCACVRLARFELISRLRVDRRLDRQPRPQQLEVAVLAVERDAHRHALHDLGEVAGRVLGWQHAELRARGRGEAHDVALERALGRD